MTRRDPRTYLYDISCAIDRVRRFLDGKRFSDYEQDDLLRSAVERQFEIIGEAVGKLYGDDPSLVEKIPEYRRIIGLRNIHDPWLRRCGRYDRLGHRRGQAGRAGAGRGRTAEGAGRKQVTFERQRIEVGGDDGTSTSISDTSVATGLTGIELTSKVRRWRLSNIL